MSQSVSSHAPPAAWEFGAQAPAARAEPLLHPHARPAVAWQRRAAERFRERMLDRDDPFPCVFGSDALRRGTLRLAFVPVGPDRVESLSTALAAFTRVAAQLGRRTSLVCFFEHDPAMVTVEHYQDLFWSLLQALHEADPAAWPEDIAVDPDDPTWEFCFNGIPMFVVANTPAHVHRRSRSFDYFTITFQPRFVFEDIDEGSAKGRRARAVIRSRLERYDDVPQTPYLASFGQPGTREWVQYFLHDDNAEISSGAACPMTMRTGT